MATSPTTSQQPDKEPPKLLVDFSWKKFQYRITSPENPSEPLYIVHFRSATATRLVFNSGADDSTKIGTGNLHVFGIDADYEIHGQKGTLKALKRWKTIYTHLSRAFTNDDGSPATMTWRSESSFSNWDFVCLDEKQMPVAKFSCNMWALKKLGNIEFVGGGKEMSTDARDEIVVLGLTLFYCMTVRTTSIFSLFGAIFAKPGPLTDGKDGGGGGSQ